MNMHLKCGQYSNFIPSCHVCVYIYIYNYVCMHAMNDECHLWRHCVYHSLCHQFTLPF